MIWISICGSCLYYIWGLDYTKDIQWRSFSIKTKFILASRYCFIFYLSRWLHLIHFRFPSPHLWIPFRTLVLEEYQLWSFYWKAAIADVGTIKQPKVQSIKEAKITGFFSRFTIDFIFWKFIFCMVSLSCMKTPRSILRCTLPILDLWELPEAGPCRFKNGLPREGGFGAIGFGEIVAFLGPAGLPRNGCIKVGFPLY